MTNKTTVNFPTHTADHFADVFSAYQLLSCICSLLLSFTDQFCFRKTCGFVFHLCDCWPWWHCL